MELITVITILVILWTIAYTSLNSGEIREQQAKKQQDKVAECKSKGEVYDSYNMNCKAKIKYCSELSDNAEIVKMCLDQNL